jgi:hypothetical protein
MTHQGIKKCAVRLVRKVEFGAGLSYDFRDFWVMNMTNGWE